MLILDLKISIKVICLVFLSCKVGCNCSRDFCGDFVKLEFNFLSKLPTIFAAILRDLITVQSSNNRARAISTKVPSNSNYEMFCDAIILR